MLPSESSGVIATFDLLQALLLLRRGVVRAISPSVLFPGGVALPFVADLDGERLGRFFFPREVGVLRLILRLFVNASYVDFVLENGKIDQGWT